MKRFNVAHNPTNLFGRNIPIGAIYGDYGPFVYYITSGLNEDNIQAVTLSKRGWAWKRKKFDPTSRFYKFVTPLMARAGAVDPVKPWIDRRDNRKRAQTDFTFSVIKPGYALSRHIMTDDTVSVKPRFQVHHTNWS